MTAEQDVAAPAAETPGAAWRAATWVILVVDALIVYVLLGLQGQERHGFDIIAAAGFVGGFFALIGMTIMGVGFGAIGAKRAADHGDRRFIVILPVFAHVVLLMWAIATLAANR